MLCFKHLEQNVNKEIIIKLSLIKKIYIENLHSSIFIFNFAKKTKHV